jgi:hypothetical protein
MCHSTSIVLWGQCYGVGRHNSTWQNTIGCCHRKSDRYTLSDEIVQPYVIPFIQAQANNTTFQQDNTRPHVARVVRDYLTQQNVDLLPWPAVSPDLLPIEHVWDEIERRLRHLPNQPVTLAEMGLALIRIWNNIPQAFFNNWVRSIDRRCQACINANGGHTRY